MHAAPTARELYPHRELGVALLVVGILLLIVAVAIGGYCAYSAGGPSYPPMPVTQGCYYPYAGAAVVLGLVGFILLIYGLILIVTRNPVYSRAMAGYFAAPWPPVPPPPPVPAAFIACKSCGHVYHVGQFAFCPNCGTKLGP